MTSLCRRIGCLHETGSLDKKPIGFFHRLWIIAKHKLCVQSQFMKLTRFVHQDNLHKII